jgi:hypothetical protein
MNKQPNVSVKAPSEMTSQSEMNTNELTIPGREILTEIEAALIAQGVKQRHSTHCAHFTAIKNWLGKYQPPIGVSNREQVRGYLEAYYHLREIGALHQAVRVLRVSINIRKKIAYQRWHLFEEKWDQKN